MKRILKFRVWDKERSRFWLTRNSLYFYLENLQDEILAVSISKFIQRGDSFVVQQFTGLLDKDGREIYEGDIIKLISKSDLTQDCYDLNHIFQIKWSRYSFLPFSVVYEKDTIIIGNVLENPELLEETKV